MTDQATIFEGTPAPAVVPEVPAVAPVVDTTNEYIGEGKKYATSEAALAAVPHAQAHIQSIEIENASLKEQLTKAATLDEVINSLENKQPKTEIPSETKVDESLIDNMLEKKLIERDQIATAKANIATVVGKLTEDFGSEGEAKYKATAAEYGMPIESLNKLAANSPLAVLKMIGAPAATTVADVAATKTTSTLSTETHSGVITEAPSGKVPMGATSKDIATAWRNCKPTN